MAAQAKLFRRRRRLPDPWEEMCRIPDKIKLNLNVPF